MVNKDALRRRPTHSDRNEDDDNCCNVLMEKSIEVRCVMNDGESNFPSMSMEMMFSTTEAEPRQRITTID